GTTLPRPARRTWALSMPDPCWCWARFNLEWEHTQLQPTWPATTCSCRSPASIPPARLDASRCTRACTSRTVGFRAHIDAARIGHASVQLSNGPQILTNLARQIDDAIAGEPPIKPWHECVALILVPTAISTALLGLGLLLGVIQVFFNT